MGRVVYVLLNQTRARVRRIHPPVASVGPDRAARRRARRLNRVAHRAMAWRDTRIPRVKESALPILHVVDDPWNHRWQARTFLVAVVALTADLRGFVVVSQTEQALQTSLCVFFVGRKPRHGEVRWVLERLDRVLRHVCHLVPTSTEESGDDRRAFRFLVAPLAVTGCHAGGCATPSMHIRCRIPFVQKTTHDEKKQRATPAGLSTPR